MGGSRRRGNGRGAHAAYSGCPAAISAYGCSGGSLSKPRAGAACCRIPAATPAHAPPAPHRPASLSAADPCPCITPVSQLYAAPTYVWIRALPPRPSRARTFPSTPVRRAATRATRQPELIPVLGPGHCPGLRPPTTPPCVHTCERRTCSISGGGSAAGGRSCAWYAAIRRAPGGGGGRIGPWGGTWRSTCRSHGRHATDGPTLAAVSPWHWCWGGRGQWGRRG